MSEEFDVTDWTKLGALLREARLTRRISQAELADQADVARSWLARVEAGHRNAELEPLLRLLAALELSLTLRPTSGARAQTQRARHHPGARATGTELSDDVRAASPKRRAAWGLSLGQAGKATADD